MHYPYTATAHTILHYIHELLNYITALTQMLTHLIHGDGPSVTRWRVPGDSERSGGRGTHYQVHDMTWDCRGIQED